uniref:Synergin gamma C-terminal domain-containing protein n=1 Tax=Oryza rufipogon TaxID=4529 RepID=A0A0E0RDR1_ORYRU
MEARAARDVPKSLGSDQEDVSYLTCKQEQFSQMRFLSRQSNRIASSAANCLQILLVNTTHSRHLSSLASYLAHSGPLKSLLGNLARFLCGDKSFLPPSFSSPSNRVLAPLSCGRASSPSFLTEDWSLFTSVDENLNHVRTTNHIETCKSTGPNDAAILDLYKETELVDAVHMTQSSSESVQSPSDMFSNNEMLREETLTVIFRNGKDFKEICEKLPEGFCIEEHTAKDVFISELLDSAREVHLKDFEEEYHLIEKIPMHGVVLWQESCQSNVCSVVISQGGQFFIALGEIYRVAQILNLSLQSFKPWVLADPGMVSKMLVCWDGCLNAWTNNGLGTALRMVVDSNNLDAPVAKVLLESIIKIDEIEVATLQCSLPNSKMTCRHTLLPTSVLPGMEVIIWDGDHYFVKVANLWTNRISSDPPQFSHSCHLNK